MAATHSKPLLQGEFPQYAYALAILTGGIVFMVSQMGAPLVAWASYALIGALLGFIWPRGGLQWGVWLCLPIILLICFDVVLTWSLGGLLGYVIILGQALGCACLGAYLGSRLYRRNVTNRSANKRVKRKRASVAVKDAQPLPASKDLAVPLLASAKTTRSSQSVRSGLEAIEPAAHVDLLNAALIAAVKAGDLNRIERLIADGADVNAKSRDQWSPLTTGSPGSELELVETLFGEGAIKTNSLAGQGWTPLMIATIEGHREVVCALLEGGAEVNAESNRGWTALRFAVSMDETEILRLLLVAGADANLTDHEGTTALMQAAGENSVESLKALLDAGADPLVKDRSLQTALTLAQKEGHTNVIKLLKGAEAKAPNKLKAPADIADEASRACDKTHRVIKVLRDHGYGSMARYNAIPLGAALPFGCEETGREGNEEECLDYAWRSSIDVQPKLAGLLGFREKLPSL
jgi:ankyrin repeat protein